MLAGRPSNCGIRVMRVNLPITGHGYALSAQVMPVSATDVKGPITCCRSVFRRHACRYGSLVVVWAAWWASTLACTSAQAKPIAGTPPSQEPDRIVDVETGLIWSRCVEGMTWNGKTCIGEAKLVAHGEARALATARSQAEDSPWRVPTLLEHRHFVAPLLRADQRTGVTTLPGSPPGCYWTTSVSIHEASVNSYAYNNIQKGLTAQNINRLSFLHAWCIDVGNGAGREALRRERLPVRLVMNAKH